MISDSLTALPLHPPQKKKPQKKQALITAPLMAMIFLLKIFFKSRFYLLISRKNPTKTPIQA